MKTISDSTYKGMVNLLKRVLRDMPSPYQNRRQGETIRQAQLYLKKLQKIIMISFVLYSLMFKNILKKLLVKLKSLY